MTKLFTLIFLIGFIINTNISIAMDSNPIKYLKQNSLLDCYILRKSSKNKWERNVWSIIDLGQKINTPLFFPYNEIDLMETDRSGSDTINGFTTLKNESIQWNLWNIIVSNIMYGNLSIYSPVNPDWFSDKDHGFLNYPITPIKYGNSKSGTFYTDEKFRQNIKNFGLLGFELIGYPEPLMSIEFPGEDSIDNNGYTLYYPFPYKWYLDRDIIKFKIKEKWTYNKKGLVVDKNISSIAPIVNKMDYNGKKMGEKELFWLDYNELKPILKNYKLLVKHKKKDALISLFKFLNNRMFYAEIVKIEERNKVSKN